MRDQCDIFPFPLVHENDGEKKKRYELVCLTTYIHFY